ncbi:MAG: glycosyl transferase, partial [Clostridiales bacterium]|nr:glycosyl transferase [Clostridiales bacterium]
GTEEKRAVIDTLGEILKYSLSISVGKNGLPLLDKADWNDTLRLNPDWINGPEKEKRYSEQLKKSGKEYGTHYESDDAESVMNAFLVKLAIDDLAVLYKMRKIGELSGAYSRMSDTYADLIRLTSWKEDFYARALINASDKYKYLGGKGDGLSADPNIDGTYWLNSFSWSVLSGVANEYQISRMVDSIEKYLKTESGIKLCSPSELGRIKGEATSSPYFPGDRENGGVFKHAEMMGTAAMIKAAKSVKDKKLSQRLMALADFAFDTVLPYKTLNHPYKTKGNPRFCTQYINAQTGENIGPMLSGTASWLMLSIIEQIGFNPIGNRIEFNPILKNDQKELNYCIDLDGTKYSVRVKSGKGEKRVTSNAVFTCDGAPFNGTLDKLKDKKNHKILIAL